MSQLFFVLALVAVSQGTPQQQQPKRPDSAQTQAKAEPKTAPVATASTAKATKSDTGTRRAESDTSEKRPSFWAVTITDVLVALATIAMAIVAALQLKGFNRQGRVIDAHVVAMEAAATAMQGMAGSAKDLNTAVTRLENRLNMLQQTLKAKGSVSPYKKD